MGLRATRGLSQSFLAAPTIAEAMVRAAELKPADTVLEIGPGLGVLTRPLVESGARVVCIELDRALAAGLPASLASPPNLGVVQGDAMVLDFAALVEDRYVAVASLPYHIATPILFKLLFKPPRPRRVVVMLQLEVARRIAAPPGAMTYLGAAIATVAEARMIRRVAPGSFFPRPKVRSAVVRLDLRPEPVVQVDSLDAFLDFLRSGFAQPRKHLRNSLAEGLGAEPGRIDQLATAADIDPRRRPGELALEEWERLYRALVNSTAHGELALRQTQGERRSW